MNTQIPKGKWKYKKLKFGKTQIYTETNTYIVEFCRVDKTFGFHNKKEKTYFGEDMVVQQEDVAKLIVVAGNLAQKYNIEAFEDMLKQLQKVVRLMKQEYKDCGSDTIGQMKIADCEEIIKQATE